MISKNRNHLVRNQGDFNQQALGHYRKSPDLNKQPIIPLLPYYLPNLFYYLSGNRIAFLV
jgi:hypothetical protein